MKSFVINALSAAIILTIATGCNTFSPRSTPEEYSGGAVSGTLYESDGKTPAVGALVTVLPRSFHSPITGANKRTAVSYAVSTGTNGYFILIPVLQERTSLKGRMRPATLYGSTRSLLTNTAKPSR